MSTAKPIQYGPPPLRPGYRWETRDERDARYAAMDARNGLRPYRVHLRGGNLPLVRVLGTDPDDACKVAVEMFGGEAFDVGSCPLPLP